MSERTRLTIAVLMTTILLAAASIAGIALHSGSTPAAGTPVPLTSQTAHPTSTHDWHEPQD